MTLELPLPVRSVVFFPLYPSRWRVESQFFLYVFSPKSKGGNSRRVNTRSNYSCSYDVVLEERLQELRWFDPEYGESGRVELKKFIRRALVIF